MLKLAEKLTEVLGKEPRIEIVVKGFHSTSVSSHPFVGNDFSLVNYRDLEAAFALDAKTYDFLVSTKSIFWANDDMPCPVASLCHMSLDQLGQLRHHELLPLILGAIDTRMIPSAT